MGFHLIGLITNLWSAIEVPINNKRRSKTDEELARLAVRGEVFICSEIIEQMVQSFLTGSCL